jgi:hypothetical protein
MSGIGVAAGVWDGGWMEGRCMYTDRMGLVSFLFFSHYSVMDLLFSLILHERHPETESEEKQCEDGDSAGWHRERLSKEAYGAPGTNLDLLNMAGRPGGSIGVEVD